MTWLDIVIVYVFGALALIVAGMASRATAAALRAVRTRRSSIAAIQGGPVEVRGTVRARYGLVLAPLSATASVAWSLVLRTDADRQDEPRMSAYVTDGLPFELADDSGTVDAICRASLHGVGHATEAAFTDDLPRVIFDELARRAQLGFVMLARGKRVQVSELRLVEGAQVVATNTMDMAGVRRLEIEHIGTFSMKAAVAIGEAKVAAVFWLLSAGFFLIAMRFAS